MIDSVLNLMFRCSHRRLTRPLTPVPRSGGPSEGTYVVCLDCGKHFAYDTKEMRIGKVIRGPAPGSAPEPSEPGRKPPLKYLVWAFVPIGFLVGSLIRNGRSRRSR